MITNQVLKLDYETGSHYLTQEAIVKMCYLSLRSRRQNILLKDLFIKAGLDSKILENTKFAAKWLYENLEALSNVKSQKPSKNNTPPEWLGLIEEFWRRAHQIDIELVNDKKKQPCVFICYSHKDIRFVRNLEEFLRKNQIEVWIDEKKISIGDSLIGKLSRAIYEVDFVIVVLSKASVASKWVNHELEIAMTNEIASKKIKVLPLLKEECDFPLYLDQKVYADFRKPNQRKKARELLYKSIVNNF